MNCSLPGNSLWTDPSVAVVVFDIFPFCLVHNTDRTDVAVIATEVTSQIDHRVSMPFSLRNPNSQHVILQRIFLQKTSSRIIKKQVLELSRYDKWPGGK